MGQVLSPVLCRGNVSGAVVSELTQGERSGAYSGAILGSMNVGDHLFVAKNDWTQTEYLGKINAVGGGEISFQFPAQSTRDTGAATYSFFTPEILWQATSVVGTGGTTTSVEAGIETLDTQGKQLLHTQVKESRDYLEILIRDAQASDWQEYRDFIATELAGGLYQFCVAYMDPDDERVRVDVVKFRAPGTPLQATAKAYRLRSWAIDLQILQRDYFIPS